MTGPFGTTPGPWEVGDMGDIVSGQLNVCILYATRKEDKRAMAQVPAMLELVRMAAKGGDNLCHAAEMQNMARAIVAKLEEE